jgi:hypothetical protein
VRTGAALLFAGLLIAVAGCGKKGPPLPPLRRLPAAPAEFAVSRRGATVALQFAIPRANTDGSTPADVDRVDIYAIDGPSAAMPDDVIKRGTRIASVKVNPPKDPDQPEVSVLPAEPPKRKGKRISLVEGLDQGAVAHLSDALADALAGPAESDTALLRSYVAVGVNGHGRRGAVSQARASLVTPPPAPSAPTISYDEKTITVEWKAPAVGDGKTLAYRVYVPGERERALTDKPIEATRFEDTRIEWGAERCYVVRAVETANNLSVESEASSSTCDTLTDTFPPAAPTGLQAVSVDGVVDLFWETNGEADIAGYIVYRAIAPETKLVPVTPAMLTVPGFRETVPRNTRVLYAVQALDTVGNASQLSATIEETTR